MTTRRSVLSFELLLKLTQNCHLHTTVVVTQTRREQVCKTLNIEISNPSNANILQRLVRRYLFKLERTKEEGRCLFRCMSCSITTHLQSFAAILTAFLKT